MPDAIRNADDCVQALQSALAVMDSPLEIYEGVLQLIAEFVPYGKVEGAVET